MTTNIFELASRKKLRFDSPKGSVSVEAVWELPLSALDAMAKKLNREIKELSEESFIKRANPQVSELNLQFNIVKHIIDVRLEEKEAADQKAKRAKDNEFIKQILADREKQELLTKDKSELLAMLND